MDYVMDYKYGDGNQGQYIGLGIYTYTGARLWAALVVHGTKATTCILVMQSDE